MDLVFGYLGFGNYGDEQLASLVEQKLQSNTTKRLSTKHTFIQHLSLLVSCKRIIAIGGMFQDISSKSSVLYYSMVLIFAKLLGKKIVLLAQGLGPLNSFWTKLFTFMALKLSDQISVRDQMSSEFLEDLKIKHEKFSDLFWSQFQEELSPGDKKNMLVSLRASTKLSESFLNEMASKINNEYKAVIFLIMQKEDLVSNSKLELLLDDSIDCEYCYASEYSIQELVQYLSQVASSIYSMRYHALILAAMAGLEINAIDNDPKNLELVLQLKENKKQELKERALQNFKLLQDKS